MTADAVVSRELKALHEEVSTSHRRRSSRTADHASAGAGKPTRSHPPQEAADEQELRGELHELVKAITEFVDDAEKNISAHPTTSVVGALMVGILIGRLLGRH